MAASNDRQLPSFLQDLLAAPPRAGEGARRPPGRSRRRRGSKTDCRRRVTFRISFVAARDKTEKEKGRWQPGNLRSTAPGFTT